jgi:hypothetical protein
MNKLKFGLVSISLLAVCVIGDAQSFRDTGQLVKSRPIPREKFQAIRPAITTKPFVELIDPATGKKAQPTQPVKLANGKTITVAEFWRQMNSLEANINRRGFTLHDMGKEVKLKATFTNADLQRQVAKDGRAALSESTKLLYERGPVASGLMFPSKANPNVKHLPISLQPAPAFKFDRTPGQTSANFHFIPRKADKKTVQYFPMKSAGKGNVGLDGFSFSTHLQYGAVSPSPDNPTYSNVAYSTQATTSDPHLLFNLPTAPYARYMWQMIDQDANPNGFGAGDPHFGDMVSNLMGWGIWKTTVSNYRNLLFLDLTKWMGFANETQIVPHHFMFRAVPVGANGEALDVPSNVVFINLVPATNIKFPQVYWPPQFAQINSSTSSPVFDRTWGDEAIMAVFLRGGIVSSGDTRDQSKDVNFKAGVYVLNCELDLITAAGHAHVALAPAGSAQAQADASLSVKILGKEVITNPHGNTTGYDQSISLGLGNLVDYPVNVGFQQGVPVGPIDVSIIATFGGDFGIGATLDVDTGPEALFGAKGPTAETIPFGFSLTPHASIVASATGAAGIGIDGFDIVSVGADLNLNILTINSAFTVNSAGQYAFVLQDATVCSGNIDAYAALGPCPFCLKPTVEICSWPGIDLTGGSKMVLFQGQF